jgi:transcriptional regulator with XRE-family HTH domain
MDVLEKNIRSIDVGSRLRAMREERHLSMRSLAHRSGLSTNALSMIERGRTSPSVSTLYKISEALGVPITAFFRAKPARQDVVFRKAAARMNVPFTRGLWEGLGGEAFVGEVEPFMLTLEPGGGSGPFSMLHTGHEFVYCLCGELEYEVESQRYSLEPGDSLLFAAQLHHRWRNSARTTTQAIIVLAAFGPAEKPSEFHLSATSKGSAGDGEGI